MGTRGRPKLPPGTTRVELRRKASARTSKRHYHASKSSPVNLHLVKLREQNRIRAKRYRENQANLHPSVPELVDDTSPPSKRTARRRAELVARDITNLDSTSLFSLFNRSAVKEVLSSHGFRGTTDTAEVADVLANLKETVLLNPGLSQEAVFARRAVCTVATTTQPTNLSGLARAIGVSRRTLGRGVAQRTSATNGTGHWVCKPRETGHFTSRAWQETLAKLEAFVKSPAVSQVSPFKRHVRFTRCSDGTKQKQKWHFLQYSVCQLWQMFHDANPGIQLGLRSLYRILQGWKWLKRGHLSGQQMVCVCPYHQSMRWLLQAFNGLGSTDTEWVKVTVSSLFEQLKCTSTGGDSEVSVKCVEGRCCGPCLPTLPAINVNPDDPITYKVWVKEQYETSKGLPRERKVPGLVKSTVGAFLAQVWG